MTMYQGGETTDLLDASQPFSRVDRYSRFDGRYEAMQNLLVEGNCTGEIDCRGTLAVAEGATVEATIIARDVRIAGEVKGDIECSGRFELLPSGRASGSVKAHQIVIHEGAEYDGELQMTTDAPAAATTTAEAPVWESDGDEADEDDESAAAPRAAASRNGAAREEPEAEDALSDDEEPENLPDFLRPRRE